MKQISRTILFLTLFAATFVARADEAISSSTVTNTVIAATATEKAEPLVATSAPTLFKIGSVPITNSILFSWLVVLAIVLFVQIATRRMDVNKPPTGTQNLLEALVEGWDSISGMILEPKVSRWVFPFAVTFFIFALVSNLIDLLPGIGSIGYGHAAAAGTAFSSWPLSIEHARLPFMRPPTSDANLTVAMATIFLVMTFIWALRYNGIIGTVKHIFGVKVETTKWLFPLVLLMFLFVGAMEALSIVFVRPLALAVRLYGNIYAGETLLAMTATMKPFILGLLVTVPFYFFELFVAVVQAFVFAMLTIVFAGTLCSHADEEHDH